jgi:hypothetical protein
MQIEAEGKIKMNCFSHLKNCHILFFVFKDIQKFVYMLQYGQAWHFEQVYEFTMKLRSNKFLLEKFINDMIRDGKLGDSP